MQTDFNGDFEEFNIITVKNISKDSFSFQTFPNPTIQNNINLKFKELKGQEVVITIRDINGREFFSKTEFIESNSETTLLSIDSKLMSGLYLITASTENTFYSQKINIR